MYRAYKRDGLVSITLCSFKKRDNSLGKVGNVGKSEKSVENSPRKIFQNAYTNIGVEPQHWLYAVPLHPNGRPRLVDVFEFI